MQIREIMKENPSCISVDATLKEAAEKMRELGAGILPVVEGEALADCAQKPIGVVTDRDIVVRCVSEGDDPETALVRDAMTRETVTCSEECSASEAFQKMRDEGVGRLLVVDESEQMIGIVTMADLISRVPREILDQLPGAKRSQPRAA